MVKQRSFWVLCFLILLTAFAFRFAVARYLPSDEPGDGKIYAQMARNLLEQHVFSHATGPPYDPSIIRLPGYPLFLAGIYWLFGHTNNGAVRVTQAVLATLSCVLVALIAFYWEPDENRKRAAALWAFLLAAVCPFSTIYTATILTETPTIFLMLAMCATATFAFRSTKLWRSVLLWLITGTIAGIAVLFRPDSGLFAAAIGVTVVGSILWHARDAVPTKRFMRRLGLTVALGAVFSIGFCIVLLPWTIRNKRVFHIFQPLAPVHAEMPGEFVPRGYLAWLRTWIEDGRYIGPVLWKLEDAPISIDEFPNSAFDSVGERQRVAMLLDRYNHPPGEQTTEQALTETPNSAPPEKQSEAQASPEENQSEAQASPEESPGGEEADEGDEDEKEESETEQQQSEETQAVAMTPEIDQGFARIAQERIARAPIRYYLTLPLRRAVSLWFYTHSQYYPFEGELTPLEDLDYDIHQQYWLPLFAALTLIYSLLGIRGGWLMWGTGDFSTRCWVTLTCLLMFFRLAFFSSLENPEPRYVVEFFPLLSILGGIALARKLQHKQQHLSLPKESLAE